MKNNIWDAAQVGELDWHNKNPWREDDWDFIINTYKIFNSMGFDRDYLKGKTVLDVGAGPRLRTKYFKDATIIALEPLGREYIQNFDWCDLGHVSLYTNPIEEFIPELENKFDFVISINALDHCYDFNKSVENMCRYLKEDGSMLLSYDYHDGSDPLHPLSLSNEFSLDVFKANNLQIYTHTKRIPYGLGGYASNYHLTKR
jgi:SAM-dependent methyltransferase